MFGISTATTGFPLNMIESEQITNQERIKYLGYKSIAIEIISLIIPMLLGAYITVYSYEVAAMFNIKIDVKFLYSKQKCTKNENRFKGIFWNIEKG